MTPLMVRYSHLSEVVNMVLKEFLISGRFCLSLLSSMNTHRVSQEEWLVKIKALATEKKFMESKKTLKRCLVYEGITKLLSETGHPVLNDTITRSVGSSNEV